MDHLPGERCYLVRQRMSTDLGWKPSVVLRVVVYGVERLAAFAFAAFAAFFAFLWALRAAFFFAFRNAFFLAGFWVSTLPVDSGGSGSPAAAAVPAKIATSERDRTSVRSMGVP